MFEPGSKVFVRTVTYHSVGEVVKSEEGWLYLKDASWVADSGRFNIALSEGTLSEVEVVGDMAINCATIVDAFPWRHSLPTASI
jgi:hypothetical protein